MDKKSSIIIEIFTDWEASRNLNQEIHQENRENAN